MMVLQLYQINKCISVSIQTTMQSSPMVQKTIPKLSMKTIKKISSLQQRKEPINEKRKNITPTQNDTIMLPLTNENECNLDSLTPNNVIIASSNLQDDSGDLS